MHFADLLGKNTCHTCAHTFTSYFNIPYNKLPQTGSCGTRVTPLSVSFWLSFSVPTKEWEIQYLVKNERVCLQSLNRGQFVAAWNFLAINAQGILSWPGLQAPSGVLVTVSCSEGVWHGALFWVLLVTSTRSLFFECIGATVQRPTAAVHSVCCIIVILSVLLGEAYNSCARWICSWSGKSEAPCY